MPQAANSAKVRSTPGPPAAWFALALCAAGLLAYGNCYRAPFTLDDPYHIENNPAIRGLTSSILAGGRRPVANFSLAVNYAIGKTNVRGYRMVNVAIHLLAGLTLFGIVRRTLLLPTLASRYGDSANWLAFAVGLLWTVHPLQSEAVTYVIQRHESMMGLFFLACVYFQLRGAQSACPLVWYAAALVAGWLAIGTKEVAAMLPVVALLFDRVFLSTSWREPLRRRGLLHLGLWLGVVWLLLRMRQEFAPLLESTASEGGTAAPSVSAGFGMEGITSWQYFRSQPSVILHYLRLAFWPNPLCLDYKWPIATTWQQIYVPGILVVCLLVASVIALGRRPALGFLGLAFFLILAPTSSIMPIADLAAEHRMYLPLATIVALVVFGIDLVRRQVATGTWRDLVAVGVLALGAIGLILLTRDRNRDYADPVRLWSKVVAVAPRNFRGHNHLGMGLESQGRPQEALEHYRLALELKPDFVPAIYNLALFEQGRAAAQEAERLYRQAIRLNPEHDRSHLNLGLLLENRGDLDEASKHYERAIAINPHNLLAYSNYGSLKEKRGDLAGAVALYRAALRHDADFLPALARLALALERQGHLAESVDAMERALRLEPRLLEVKLRLGWIRAASPDDTLRNGREALRLARESLDIAEPSDHEPFDLLGAAAAETGEFVQAVRAAKRAEQLAASAGKGDSAKAIRQRRELYEAEEAYRLGATISSDSRDRRPGNKND